MRDPKRYYGGSWTPEDGYQPLEMVSAYPAELRDPSPCGQCGSGDHATDACPLNGG